MTKPLPTRTDILLHICCAPCLTVPLEVLRSEGLEPTLLFLNPNIEPDAEYRSRLETLRTFTIAREVSLFVEPLERGSWRRALFDIPNRRARCAACYRFRLDRTAQYARERGFALFSTTLLVSPYQNQDDIIAAGQAAASLWGVSFEYQDYRPRYRDSLAMSRALGLYRQWYCGCLLSKEEREIERSVQRHERSVGHR